MFRERAAGTYNVGAYWLAEYLAEVPWVALKAAIYSIIIYFRCGWEEGGGSDGGPWFAS